ncbi:hypothetical protein [Magnetospirillum sp. UT-4]|uniref:hypothetical protein n=1 Tax=Magnetospirillum sp. UT-4 TaxID=2681467 RepID=UPI00137FF87D|nr:hypothetical protein [Magnetospirillum sp. UT-4]CAA7614119.1 hypothetical protein MTBUT4_170017 [Magnetospirillum sp. UT-4]
MPPLNLLREIDATCDAASPDGTAALRAPVSAAFIEAVKDGLARLAGERATEILDLEDIGLALRDRFPIYAGADQRYREDLFSALHTLDMRRNIVVAWDQKVVFVNAEYVFGVIAYFVKRVTANRKRRGYLEAAAFNGVLPSNCPIPLQERVRAAIKAEPVRRGIAAWLPRELGEPPRLVFPGLFGPKPPLQNEVKVRWGTIFFSRCNASIMLPMVVAYLDGREKGAFRLLETQRNAAEFRYSKGTVLYHFGILAKRFDSRNAMLALYFKGDKNEIILGKADGHIRDCLRAVVPGSNAVLRVDCGMCKVGYLDELAESKVPPESVNGDGRPASGPNDFIDDIMVKLKIGRRNARLNLRYSAANEMSSLTLDDIKNYTISLFEKLGSVNGEFSNKGEARRALREAKNSGEEECANPGIEADVDVSYTVDPGVQCAAQ